jgi:uncharacterized membrane protein YeaQ/YmgE (transglycosylase-associated protein family)
MSPLLWFILIGLVAGWIVGQFVKGGGYGVFADSVVGVIGAVIGGFLFRAISVTDEGELLNSLLVATFGAVILVLLVHQLKRT